MQSCVSTLQRVYGALGEPDYVAGLVKTRKSDPSIGELMEQHRITGNYQDALACCESMGRTHLLKTAAAQQTNGAQKKVSPKLAGSILKCYLEMDQPHTASTLAKGLVESNPDLSEELKVIELESAWQLGQWSRIETEVKACTATSKAEPTHCHITIAGQKVSSSNWNVSLSKLLYFARQNDRGQVTKLLESSRLEQVWSLTQIYSVDFSKSRIDVLKCYGILINNGSMQEQSEVPG